MPDDTKLDSWTILIYFAADNNLSEEMIWALKDIQEGRDRMPGYKGKVNLMCLLDAGGPPILVNFNNLKRDQVSNNPALASAPQAHQFLTLQQKTLRQASGGKFALESVRKTLHDFIEESIGEPTDHYMLILSGHGSGAVGDFLTGDKRTSGLTIRALGQTVRQMHEQLEKRGRKLDILGMDSCQMTMAEVAYEVQGAVDLMVGSEGFALNTGWPYLRVFAMLADPQNANDPAKFAENIVRVHIGYYLDFASVDLSTDISALQPRNYFGSVVKGINQFTTALGIKKETKDAKEARRKLDPISLSKKLDELVDGTELADPDLCDAIVLAHREAQGYKRDQHADLWDFCDRLSDRLTNRNSDKYGKIVAACIAIRDAIDPLNGKQGEGVVLRSGYSGAAFQYSNGLSIFFPWASLTDAAGTPDLDHYGVLGFARDTAWDEFLRVYLHATKRKPRERNTEGNLLTSMLNRRSTLFTGEPGAKDSEVDPVQRDSEVDPVQRTSLVTARIESMKNPPTDWKQCKLDE